MGMEEDLDGRLISNSNTATLELAVNRPGGNYVTECAMPVG